MTVTNCGKKNNSSTDGLTAGTYTTCPTTGYYTYNGVNYACTAGTTVLVGGTGSTLSTTGTTGYVTCPTTGYYTYNGMTYACTVGSTVYVGGTTTTTNYYSSACSQYTAMYGVPYVMINYGGSYTCARCDVAQSYGYSCY
jgi:hypothetical protein